MELSEPLPADAPPESAPSGPFGGRLLNDPAPVSWRMLLLAGVGIVSGAATGMNSLAAVDHPGSLTLAVIITHLSIMAGVGLVAVGAMALVTRALAASLHLPDAARQRYFTRDAMATLVLLGTLAGAVGVMFYGPVIAILAGLLLIAKAWALISTIGSVGRRRLFSSMGWLAFLFLVSGFAALIYQIVWERVLFAAFGVNIESITIVVSLFMFGLGLGSLVGGLLARRFPNRAPLLFLTCELLIGGFGIASLPLIRIVSNLTIQQPAPVIALAIFALLCLPTMLMGATLPILVGHLYRHYRNLGQSVGILYCINTVGSAIACFITADLLFVLTGEQGSVIVAACCNLTVGVLVSVYAVRMSRQAHAVEAVPVTEGPAVAAPASIIESGAVVETASAGRVESAPASAWIEESAPVVEPARVAKVTPVALETAPVADETASVADKTATASVVARTTAAPSAAHESAAALDELDLAHSPEVKPDETPGAERQPATLDDLGLDFKDETVSP